LNMVVASLAVTMFQCVAAQCDLTMLTLLILCSAGGVMALFMTTKNHSVDMKEKTALDDFTDQPIRVHGKELTLRCEGWPSPVGSGGVVWSATQALVSYFETHDITSKKILELGSGTGALGIAVAAMGGDVVLTDLEVVVQQIQDNIDMNAHMISMAHGRATSRLLDWHAPLPNLKVKGPWDFIIGSEITYSPDSFKPLLRLLQQTMVPKTRVLLAFRKRADNDFVAIASESLEVAPVALSDDFAHFAHDLVVVELQLPAR